MKETKTKKTSERPRPSAKAKAVISLPEVKKVTIPKNEFESKIIRVCRKNRYPFRFKDGTVNGKVPDFINRERMKIIEIYNPERTDEEVYARLKEFHICRYEVTQLVEDNLTRPDWEKFCTGSIGGFLNR